VCKPKEQKKRKEKNTYSQNSRLENPAGVVENPEELQLHHNHEKFLFLTMKLNFSQ
jgi:hypothetical protein